MAGEMLYRTLGATGERVSAIGLGGWHLALPGVDDALRPAHHPRCDRPRHHLHGQLVGLQRRRERAADGRGAPRRLPRSRLPDDQDRRAVARGGDASAGRIAPPAADRPHRSRAAPRGDSLRRSASSVRRRWRQSGAGRRACGRQAALHRFHRPQGSAHPPAHARRRTGAGIQVRHGADAAERHGRALPQLRAAGAAPAGRRGHRRAGDEADGQRNHPQVEYRDGARVPPLRAAPADVGGDHRDRFARGARSGLRGCRRVHADDFFRGCRRCWPGPRQPPKGVRSSRSRPRRCSMPPPSIPSGSAKRPNISAS